MQTLNLASERVLVTGSGGVLGTALLAELRLSGCGEVAAPHRRDCDLLDEAATLALWRDYRPTIVFHLAGWVAGVQGNLNNAGRAFYENSRINLNVIEASRLAGVRKIVAAGTTAVYSDAAPLPMREDDVWIGAPHGSEASYAHAKRAMLAHLQAYKTQYGLDFAYMICTNLYGENDRFDEAHGHVVPSLISRFERVGREGADHIVIWGDGSPTRDFLYARDAARAFLFAAAEGATGAFNTATGEAMTIRQLVETLADISQYQGEVRWDTTKPLGQSRRSYDVTRLKGLGWRPEVTLREGLGRTASWYRANLEAVRR